MSIDSQFMRLRDANPVPNPAALRERPVDPDVYLAATQQRSREMQDEFKPLTSPNPPRPPWQKWLPALTTAAVVVVAGASIALFTGDSDDGPDVTDIGPATTAASLDDGKAAVDIAMSFVAARDAWDGETVRSLIADDAVIAGSVRATTADEFLAQSEFDRATGWRFLQADCTAGSPGRVACTYVTENDWSRALGVGPFAGSSFLFVIEDGQIHELNQNFDASEFTDQVWTPFRRWVAINHPSDVALMYEDIQGVGPRPRITSEAIAFWEEYTDEFVAFQAGS